MAHHTPVAPSAQAPIARVLIPSDPDLGRLATIRPQAVAHVRAQIVGPLHPLTVDRLLSEVQSEPITGDELLAIHRDGIQARINGDSINSCPHTDDQRRTAWLDGWDTAFGADPHDLVEHPERFDQCD